MNTWPNLSWIKGKADNTSMAMIDINWKPDARTLRQFGFISLVAFGAIGTWIFLRRTLFGIEFSEPTAATTAYVLWSLAGLCAILAVSLPIALRPLYVVLLAVSLPIGYVVSHVFLGIIFYGLFTPIGLFFRLIGRDVMERNFDPAAKTYWIQRQPIHDSKRYFRQF